MPNQKRKMGTMKFSPSSRYSKEYEGKTIQEIIPIEIQRRSKKSLKHSFTPLTIIDNKGKQTTFWNSHFMSNSIKETETKNGKIVKKKMDLFPLDFYDAQGHLKKESSDIEYFKSFRQRNNELIERGAPLTEVKSVKKKGNSLVMTEECFGTAINHIKINKKTEEDILKEIEVAVNKFKRLNILPKQFTVTLHILYEPKQKNGNKIKITKAIDFVPYDEEKVKFFIKNVKEKLSEMRKK